MNMESIGKVMVLSVMFQTLTTSTCRLCHFESEISASNWARKPCVFFFGNETKTLKYIGSEFRFGDDAATKEAFKALKANFNEFFDSPLTHGNYTCDCSKVPCLNEEQLNNLFAYSVEQARKEARTRFPFLSRLCCTLQQVLGEIFFRLLPDDVEKLTTIAFKEINIHNWIVNFTNGLRQIEWCKTFQERCDSIVQHIAKGCDKKRRGKRNIGLNTTAVHGSSSCFQDTGSVSSASLIKLQETSLFHSKITTARTWSETETTIQALVWSTPRSGSSYGSRAHSEELSPSPFMSSYMTTTTAFFRSNSTLGLAPRVSKGSSPAPLSASVTRLATGDVPSTSTISTRSLKKLFAFSSEATPQMSISVTISGMSDTDLAKQLSSRQSSKNYMLHFGSTTKSTEPFVSISSSSSSSLTLASSSLSLSTTLLSLLVTSAPSPLSTSSSSSPPLSTLSILSSSPSSISPSLLHSTTPLQLFSLFPSHSSRGSSSFVERTPTNSSSRNITMTVAVKQFSSLSLSPSSSSSSLTSFIMTTTTKITLPQDLLTFTLRTTPPQPPPPLSSSSSSSLSSSLSSSSLSSLSSASSSSSSSSSSLSSSSLSSSLSSLSSASSSSSLSLSSASSSSPSSLSSASSSPTTTTVMDATKKTILSPVLLLPLPPFPSTSLPSLASLQMKVNTTKTIALPSSQSSMPFFSSMSSSLSPHRLSTPLLSTRIFSRQILSDHTMLRSYSSSNSFSTSYQPLSFTLTSSLNTSHVSTSWLVPSRSATLRNSTLILRTSLARQSSKHSFLSTTLGAESYSSSQKTIRSKYSFSNTTIAPSRTLGTYSKPSTAWPVFTETFVIKFKGNCSMITNKDAFKLSFVISLADLLRLSRSEVIVRDVICGSVDVIFQIKTARERNVGSELREIIKNESFVIKYNGTVFTAFDMKAISKPTVFSPTSSTPTEDSNHERKKLVFIIFVLFGTVFAALFLFFVVIFCSRFGACRQKFRKLRMQKKVRLRAHDFELKRFAARRSQFMGVNYYGDTVHLDENNKKESEVEIVEEDINDYYEDEFAEGHQADTNISLLSSNNHTNANKLEEHKFVFDDEDSCSSVLFY